MFYLVILILSILSFLDLYPKRYLKTFYFILFIIILIDGLRVETGTDWAIYKYFFDTSIKDFEFGYEIYINFIRSLSKNFQFFVFIHSIVVNILIYSSIFRISNYSFSSILLTYSLIETILGSNRQLLAMGIIYISFVLILENRKIGFLGIIFSPLIHTSSIIIYPYFIFNKILEKNKSIKLIFLIPILLLVKLNLVKLLYLIFDNTFLRADLILRIKEYIEYSMTNTNIKLMLNLFKLSSLIFIIQFFKIKNRDKNLDNFFTNGTIYSIVIIILFWGIFQIVAGRGSYTNIVLFIFTGVGYTIKEIKNKKKKLCLILIIICYSLMTFERGISGYRDLFIPYKGMFYNLDYERKLY